MKVALHQPGQIAMATCQSINTIKKSSFHKSSLWDSVRFICSVVKTIDIWLKWVKWLSWTCFVFHPSGYLFSCSLSSLFTMYFYLFRLVVLGFFFFIYNWKWASSFEPLVSSMLTVTVQKQLLWNPEEEAVEPMFGFGRFDFLCLWVCHVCSLDSGMIWLADYLTKHFLAITHQFMLIMAKLTKNV